MLSLPLPCLICWYVTWLRSYLQTLRGFCFSSRVLRAANWISYNLILGYDVYMYRGEKREYLKISIITRNLKSIKRRRCIQCHNQCDNSPVKVWKWRWTPRLLTLLVNSGISQHALWWFVCESNTTIRVQSDAIQCGRCDSSYHTVFTHHCNPIKWQTPRLMELLPSFWPEILT